MIDRDEAKKRMLTHWSKFYSEQEILEALLSSDQGKIDLINACRNRCSDYNSKMQSDVDKATNDEFEEMVNTFKPYSDTIK